MPVLQRFQIGAANAQRLGDMTDILVAADAGLFQYNAHATIFVAVCLLVLSGHLVQMGSAIWFWTRHGALNVVRG